MVNRDKFIMDTCSLWAIVNLNPDMVIFMVEPLVSMKEIWCKKLIKLKSYTTMILINETVISGLYFKIYDKHCLCQKWRLFIYLKSLKWLCITQSKYSSTYSDSFEKFQREYLDWFLPFQMVV